MTFVEWIVAAMVGLLSCAPGTVPPPQGEGVQGSCRRIHFSAVDENERPVLGLTEDDFELRIDGRQARLEGFGGGKPHTERWIPLVAWILLDFNPNINSSLIRDQAGSAAAIFKLFHAESLVGVKLVSDRSETLAPLCSDAGTLTSAFLQFGERRRELRAGGAEDTVSVGRGGILRACELAVRDIGEAAKSQPALRDREIHRAIIVLSDGNVDPAFRKGTLYRMAAEERVFIYPVLMPRNTLGPWVEQYFELAKKTAGVAAVFGALRAGSNVFSMPRGNSGPNALTYNLIHMARDLTGKYSFSLAAPSGGRAHKIDVKCRLKGVKVILPLKEVR